MQTTVLQTCQCRRVNTSRHEKCMRNDKLSRSNMKLMKCKKTSLNSAIYKFFFSHNDRIFPTSLLFYFIIFFLFIIKHFFKWSKFIHNFCKTYYRCLGLRRVFVVYWFFTFIVKQNLFLYSGEGRKTNKYKCKLLEN